MPFSAGSKNGSSLFAGTTQVSCQQANAPDFLEARQLLTCWREHTTQGEIVIGRDIPSRPFARFLSHLLVAVPVEGDTDCHIRLAGTLLHRYFGGDVGGKRFSDLYPHPLFEQHLAATREVLRTGGPVVLSGTIASELLPLRRFEEVILRALAPDEITIWNVIGIFVKTA